MDMLIFKLLVFLDMLIFKLLVFLDMFVSNLQFECGMGKKIVKNQPAPMYITLGSSLS